MSNTNHKIPVGISSCLLGEKVRYDGGHRYQALIVEQLGKVFDFKPVCPEMAIGLGAPRDPIQLVKTPQGIRVRRVDDPEFDATEKLVQLAKSTAQQLDMICGYIFKARSPSCGINNTNTFDENNQLIHTNGTGMYAKTIIQTMRGLPVANEDQLQTAGSVDDFIERVIAYHESQQGK